VVRHVFVHPVVLEIGNAQENVRTGTCAVAINTFITATDSAPPASVTQEDAAEGFAHGILSHRHVHDAL
jgi:hypothetical protein